MSQNFLFLLSVLKNGGKYTIKSISTTILKIAGIILPRKNVNFEVALAFELTSILDLDNVEILPFPQQKTNGAALWKLEHPCSDPGYFY